MAGWPPPDYVEEEFDAYLKRGRMEEDFLRLARCAAPALAEFPMNSEVGQRDPLKSPLQP